MISIVSTLNTVLTFLFGLVYEPLKWLGPFWSMVGISGLSGIVMVWIFGKVSNLCPLEVSVARLPQLL